MTLQARLCENQTTPPIIQNQSNKTKMEMESEDVSYEEEDLLHEGDDDGNFLNENEDQDLTGVDVDKLLGDEDEDHTMGASVDEVSENNDVVHAEETEETEDSQENSETMEEESTESYVRNNFSINDVLDWPCRL